MAADVANPLRRTRGSLFTRLVGIIVAVMLILQLADFAMIYFARLPSARFYEIEEVAQALRSGIATNQLYVRLGSPPGDRQQDNRDRRLSALLASQLGTGVENVRLRVSSPPQVFPRRSRDRSENPQVEKDKIESSFGDTPQDNVITGRFVAALRLPDGSWRVSRPPYGLEPWHWQALGGLLVAVLIALPIAWLLARRLTRPVQLFAEAAERIGNDPGAPPVEIKGPPEIVDAAIAINSLQERVKRFVDDRTALVGHIAHDMASPLMRIQLLVEQMPPAARSEVEAEIAEMRDRIRDTLAFVKNVSNPNHRRQRLRLRSLIESLCSDLADSGSRIELVDGPDPTVHVDTAGVRAMFRNLLQNSINYGAGAEISLTLQGRDVLIAIADRGPGMTSNDLSNAFEPFFRGSAASSSGVRGTGLGLASARAVARTHGGEVTLANRLAGGLVVTIRIPTSDAQPV